MPTGRVKVFDDERNFGFLQPLEGGQDVFLHVSEVDAEALRPGDLVEYELEEDDEGPRATSARVTERAPEDNPTGRVLAGAPPTWDELDDIHRQSRESHRRRRRRR